jgi:cytidylate kinase/molybdenum cofactor biosynthesis protein MoaC
MNGGIQPALSPLVITIDGPAGAGKSTLAKRLAAALGLAYLDSGAMYRTLGLRLGAEAADLPDGELRRRCGQYRFTLERETGGEGAARFALFCNGVPVGEEVRTERAGRLASLVARLPVLREALREAQRDMGRRQSLVAEGRDMGTRVFPHAAYKFFLAASPEVRAERRFQEIASKGGKPDRQAVLAGIIARDERDCGREADPLRPAADAVLVDTSELGLDSVLDELLSVVAAPSFSHLAPDGSLRMVDVGAKDETDRVARAGAVVEMRAETLEMLKRRALPKGDALAVAKIAGIMAAKRVSDFIPLCHPLSLTQADVGFTIREHPPAVLIETEVRALGRTGVEMEAIVAAQMAAAAIYDMTKAVQKDMVIRDVRLLYKAGGKSGEFRAGAGQA